jgi:two-component system OmpR family sensor kinase
MGALTTPEEVAQAMERIEKEAIRMGELVEDLLELARIDEAKPLQMKPVDLVPIAYDAALDAMASSPDRPIDVIFTEPEPEPEPQTFAAAEEEAAAASRTAAVLTSPISFAGAQLSRLRSRRPRQAPVEDVSQAPTRQQTLDTPAIVLGEENKIRQVVTNLLGNALRFTNPGSPIEIGVGVDPVRKVALLDIIDHGEGIPPQIRDKIFQRFWRADTSRTRETGGSGLGLAIVSGIIIAHKGSVDVFETEGGGATFRVEIPLLPEDYTPPAPTARA